MDGLQQAGEAFGNAAETLLPVVAGMAIGVLAVGCFALVLI